MFSQRPRPGLLGRAVRCRPAVALDERNPASFPIAAMARVLGLSQAGCHVWRRRPACAHATADAVLSTGLKSVPAGSRQTYGAPRVEADPRRQAERHSGKWIAPVMRAGGWSAPAIGTLARSQPGATRTTGPRPGWSVATSARPERTNWDGR